jgi:DNA helicase II / ATP-dependent DNA helicase PcrA
VAVLGVTSGIVPHRLADDVEEERRVLHVAITRAREAVVLLVDAARPSRFLDELTGVASHELSPSATASATIRPPSGSTPRAPAPPRDTSPEAIAAETALRQWRMQRSKRDGVPAYVVFHDSTLVAIAAQRPTTLAGLRTIPGIGPTKLDRYGDDIIEVLETAAAG